MSNTVDVLHETRASYPSTVPMCTPGCFGGMHVAHHRFSRLCCTHFCFGRRPPVLSAQCCLSGLSILDYPSDLQSHLFAYHYDLDLLSYISRVLVITLMFIYNMLTRIQTYYNFYFR